MPKWRNVPVSVRFFDKVSIPDNLDDCWIWTGARHSKQGYGSFALVGKIKIKAHRLSFVLHNPGFEHWEGVQVLHECDNNLCVNPRHLYAGDNAQNARDRAERGHCGKSWGENHPFRLHPELIPRGEAYWTPRRLAYRERLMRGDVRPRIYRNLRKGEAHPQARLTYEKVAEIRARYIPRKVSQTKLAQEYGVSRITIQLILANKAWKIQP